MGHEGPRIDSIEDLRRAIVEQGTRVLETVTLALEIAVGERQDGRERLHTLEDEVDRVDVAIERSAVRILTEATQGAQRLDERAVRTILMIVKINNEMERIADLAVDIVERSERLSMAGTQLPLTVRVMTNSTIGIVRDTNRAVSASDPALATMVLKCEDAMEVFRGEVLRAAERDLASGSLSLELTLFMHAMAGKCVSIADHCTNIAEQIIYAETGKIVRHTTEGWVDVTQDES